MALAALGDDLLHCGGMAGMAILAADLTLVLASLGVDVGDRLGVAFDAVRI
jgi:hypothetical protein